MCLLIPASISESNESTSFSEIHCRNVLVGTADSRTPDPCDAAGVVQRLVAAARLAEAVGSRLLIEPLNTIDNPGYAVSSLDTALALVDDVRGHVGSAAIAVLFDVYHLAMMGDDPVAAVERARGAIGHVQLADVPGRGAPGSGTIDFDAVIGALGRSGYEGTIALEYRPGAQPDPWLGDLEEPRPGPAAPLR